MLSATFLVLFMIHHAVSSPIAYNQPKISPNAKWDANGTTIANESIIGQEPYGLFVSSDHDIYVVSSHSKLVVLDKHWTMKRSLTENLQTPTSLVVNLNGDIYVGNENGGENIDKWTTNNDDFSREISNCGKCFGLFIDRNNSLYCSLGYQHKVIKTTNYSSASIVIIAGTGSAGANSDAFNGPRGIFVDDDFTLYVADCDNHRVQCFALGQKNATTVLGRGSAHSISLTCPHDVILDVDGYLFVADWHGNKIVAGGPYGYRCIVGCSGANGPAADQLNNPTRLQFDCDGNLYVADKGNHRIQKYLLIVLEERNATDSPKLDVTSTEKQVELSRSSESTSMKPYRIPTNQYIHSSISTVKTSNEYRTTVFRSVQYRPSDVFSPNTCPNTSSMMIGKQCDISQSPCHVISTCQSGEKCIEDENVKSGYYCRCLLENCQRQCSKQCVNGVCFGLGEDSECRCFVGWMGDHCEQRNDSCQYHKCENGGKCFVVNGRPVCQCLGKNFYSGDRCEHVEQRLMIFRIVSKSVSYVAIMIICAFILFILIMDFLKYCLGIDLTKDELEQIRMEKKRKKRRPVITKFIYVNPPPQTTQIETRVEL